MIEITNKEQFNEATANGKVLVKFSTPWCGPCRMLAENIMTVEPEVPEVKFYSVNVDEADEDFVNEFNIRNIPVLLVYENGALKERKTGLVAVDELRMLCKP